MKRSTIFFAFLLVTGTVPCVAQPVLDALSVVGDSTLAWCGVALGSQAEALDAIEMGSNLTVDHAIAPGSESGSAALCAHEAMLYFSEGRLEMIEVILPEEGEGMAASFAASLEGRVGPVEPVVSPLSERTFYVPAQVPNAAVVLDPEGWSMSIGFTTAFQDYIPAYLLE